jgi:hypothetical protein
MLDFFSTVSGRRFTEGTLPDLVHELKRLNDRADVLRQLAVVEGNVTINSGLATLPDGTTINLKP